MKTLQEIIRERVAFGAWCVFEDEMLDLAKCKRAADLGLDYCYVGFDQTHEKAKIMLDNCEKAGTRIMAFEPTVSAMPADHYYSLNRALGDVKNHPAYAGTALRDEPGVYDFSRLKLIRDEHEKIAPDKIALINLFPMYASVDQMNGVTYEQYIERFASEIGGGILSYDFYPLCGQEKAGTWLQDNYLRNFEIVARAAQRHGFDMWYFIQNLAFNYVMRDPAERDMRFQIFCALSFGARVIQLFTYGTPGNGDEFFEDALIDRKGEKTPRYDYAQKVIREFNAWTGRYVAYHWIGCMTYKTEKTAQSREYDLAFPGGIVNRQKYAGSFMDLDHELRAFAPVKSFAADGPLLMGCFEKDGGEALTLVNMSDPSWDKPAKAEVVFQGPCKLTVSGKDGTREIACDGKFDITLAPGEGVFVEIA